MPYETILLDINDNHVATITLNRPEAMNSFTAKMRKEFEHVWRVISEDPFVHAVVLRAAEGRAFSTGADVKEAEQENVLGSDHVMNQTDPGESLGPRSNQCWKPVIAAVHGLCCGGAFYWLNECDIIICSDNAQFFDPHVSYGLVCAVEPIGLSYRIGLHEALRMALMGNDERIGANTALRIGLVSEVTSTSELWARADAIAAQIAAKSPTATQGSVKAIWEALELPRRAALANGFNMCRIGNPQAATELDISAARNQERKFQLR
jgi:enoyl-CoA hydratase/carnithine racemase